MTRTFKVGQRVAVGRGGPKGTVLKVSKLFSQFKFDGPKDLTYWFRHNELIPLRKKPKRQAREQMIAEQARTIAEQLDEIERLREREAKLKAALEFTRSECKYSCDMIEGKPDEPSDHVSTCNRARTTLAELYPEDSIK